MSTLKTKVISAPINGSTVETLTLQTNNLGRVVVDDSGNVTVAENFTASKQATISGLSLLNGETRLAARLGLGGANYGTSGQVLASQGSSSAPAWVDSAGVTLLGTLTTTSGTSQTLSGLSLTDYKALKLYFSNVGSGTSALSVNTIDVSTAPTSTTSHWGCVEIDLASSVFVSTLRKTTSNSGSVTAGTDSGQSGKCTVTTATTSIVLAANGGTFTRGSVTIYGIK